MSDLLTSLTALAVSVFRAQGQADYTDPVLNWMGRVGPYDPVLKAAQSTSIVLPDRHAEWPGFVEQLLAHPDLEVLAPKEGELDPMVIHPGGAIRTPPSNLVAGLFSAAFLQIFYLRLPRNESTFVRTVLEAFDELLRAARGERVRAYVVLGIGGVTLSDDSQVSTPWGVLRPAHMTEDDPLLSFPPRTSTTCVLAETRLVPVLFDRAAEPETKLDPEDVGTARTATLFPATCAMCSPDLKKPLAPLITWTTTLLPFLASSGYSMPLLPPRFRAASDITEQIETLEEWSRVVHDAHTDTVDLAVRRLVSATAHRLDRSDRLIDAVMGWENLLGTTTEVTFRVTGALAKLLEPDRGRRRDLQKSLAGIYRVRSRLVHGEAVESSAIDEAATEAVEVLIKALRLSYRRGREWLSLKSAERANSLLLEEP